MIQKFFLAFRSLFLNACPDYIIRNQLYRGSTRRIKKYFHILYGMTKEHMKVKTVMMKPILDARVVEDEAYLEGP